MADKKPSTEVAPIDFKALVNAPLQGSLFDIPMTPDMTFDDYEAAIAGQVIDFEGSPYTVVDKERLLGLPFIITDLRAFDGDYGEAVSVMAITENNERIVFVDGSTGVYEQVKYMVQSTGRKAGIRCKGGLRVSRYTYEDEKGKETPAATYYIA